LAEFVNIVHPLTARLKAKTSLLAMVSGPFLSFLVAYFERYIGLGGTSLLNSNVFLKADKKSLKLSEWPAEIRKDPTVLDKCEDPPLGNFIPFELNWYGRL